MNIRLLKRFRSIASKEICLRRQPGNRYEVVCPINEENTLGCFTKQWVHINRIGYNQYDEYIIPFNTNFLTMEEAILEISKIRRGYIQYHLVPEFCKGLPIK